MSVGKPKMAFTMRVVTALAVAGLLAAAPAQARDWHGRDDYHGGYHHRRGGAGAAIAAGLIGLGIGAAIASRGYAPPPAYYGPPAGYYTPPPPAVYYGY